MDKTIRIIDFKNEVEAKLFCEILDKHNIPYHLRSLEDSVYNGLYQMAQGWGFLESTQDYEQQIRSLYKEFKNSEIIDDHTIEGVEESENEIKGIKFNFIDILSISIIIILAVSCYLLFRSNSDLNKEIKYYRESKIRSYKWDNANFIMVARWMSNDLLNGKYFDTNKNRIYEKVMMFNINGYHISTYFDNNENGIYEKFISYSPDGTKINEVYDFDEDGFYDKNTTYYTDKFTITWYDTDKDGVFEGGEIENSKKNYKKIDLINEKFIK